MSHKNGEIQDRDVTEGDRVEIEQIIEPQQVHLHNCNTGRSVTFKTARNISIIAHPAERARRHAQASRTKIKVRCRKTKKTEELKSNMSQK